MLTGQDAFDRLSILERVSVLTGEIIARGIHRLGRDCFGMSRRHLEALDDIYGALEAIAGIAAPELFRTVFGVPEITKRLPLLYAIRAMYEYELEWCKARDTIGSADAAGLIEADVESKRASLSAAFFDLLRDRRRLLFVGSGPLPTTAMALVASLGRSFVCLDRDGRANTVAKQYLAAGGRDYGLTFIRQDVREFDAFGDFDAVVCAFLVGVETTPWPVRTRSAFIRRLAGRLPDDTPLVLRTPRALGGLIYPPLDTVGWHDKVIFHYPPAGSPAVPYDAPFAVIHSPRSRGVR